MSLLILGGTAEARALAAALEHTMPIISSLAGRVARPRLPVGQVRIGGFGGIDGLVAYLSAAQITAVVDATHPFAAQMSAHAAAACAQAAVPLLRLARPGWAQHPDAARWQWAQSLDDARRQAEQFGDKPFLTTGRQSIPAFTCWQDREVLVRVVEPPDSELPAGWTVIFDRGPYQLDQERQLLQHHGVSVLLTKDSGGSYTAAKLTAAKDLGIPIVIVGRPATVPGITCCDTVTAAADWAQQTCR